MTLDCVQAAHRKAFFQSARNRGVNLAGDLGAVHGHPHTTDDSQNPEISLV
ncbi:hypothetical protein SV7mr_02700 [Stieleria bergensis]|uniref:Uncharacterized protein n=1 Tax=Stieleria bergensis TaxID=2528025 RepID=A0A517SNT5_9BACT|nr:hypothetical protein SV7mr_02700 [Planctomycetes bacterium SV_7m_r]